MKQSGEPSDSKFEDKLNSADLEHIDQSGSFEADRPKTVPIIAGDSDDLSETKIVADETSVPPDSSPRKIVALQDNYIDEIKVHLANYLDSPDSLNDFFPMKEWDLSAQGKLSESDILKAYSTVTQLTVVDEEELENIDRYPDATYEYLSQWLCVPISWDDESIVMVVASPYVISNISYHWKNLLNKKTEFLLGQRSHIERILSSVYDKLEDDFGSNEFDLDGDASEATLRDLASEAPIVRLVNDMFARAVEMEASDIHVEPSENALAIRYRIDGVLQTVLTPPINTFPAIACRLKLVGGLNIAERRLPQDGRTNLQIGRAQVDVRISTLPSMYGESIVLRLLRKDITSFSLDNIGMENALRKPFTKMVKMPYGMILVVGPTGSGKTTTLYCVMNLLDSEKNKIITIEDPIEYQMNGLTQIQVKPSIGLTFATGLRSIVRQDPDIILVGEIRDRETAEISIHAALTGHLVLSTLHTNDATGAISRLIDMGVEPFLISSALVGVLSQRLVRCVCPNCGGKKDAKLAAASGDSKEITGSSNSGPSSKSCRNCNGSGYRGRVGIFEFLQVDDEIRRATGEGADASELNRIARKNGMKTLLESGSDKVKKGVTTETEIARVCQLDMG